MKKNIKIIAGLALGVLIIMSISPVTYAYTGLEEAQCQSTAMTKYGKGLSCDQLKKEDTKAAKIEKEADCEQASLSKYGKSLSCDELKKEDKKTQKDDETECQKKALETYDKKLSCAQLKEAECEFEAINSGYGSMSCSELQAKKTGEFQEKNTQEQNEAMEKACQDEGYENCQEKICQTKYKTSCAVHSDKVANASGQGFKLPLDFLSLKTKDKDGKLKQQGKSIFMNKDYKQYGVLIGTLLRVIDILILVIGSVAMLTLIVGGIFMIANHGDEAWVTKGKGMMLYSILGLLFAFLSFALVNIITSITS